MEGKEDGNVDDDGIEEEGSMDGDDEMEEGEEVEDCFVGFEANKCSLDCVEDGGGGEDHREVSDKKPGNGVSIGATLEEMDVIYTCYGRRKRSRKPKKRGRLKGSRNKLSPEIENKLGDAALHYAYGSFKDAINILLEVVQIAPNISDTYHTLGLVHNSMGDKHKAMDFYSIVAIMNPKESSVWKQLVNWSIYQRASLYMEKGEHLNAAKAYNEIVQMCPKNVEALKTTTKLHKQCGQIDQSISMLEDYLKQSSEADLTVVDMLALLCMERNEFMRALQHIENVKVVCCCSGKEFPLCLKISEGVCHAHLGNMEKAKVCFSLLQRENAEHQMDLIMAVANSFQNLNQHESALKYYMMLEGCLANSELVNLKIAHCYLALNKATSAIYFFYKVLQAREDDIDTRLALVSHLLVENREDEAIALLLPPSNTELSNDMDEDRHEPWWDNVKVKLKLSDIYRSKWMLEAFVAVIHPIILESLKIDPLHQKAKRRSRLRRLKATGRSKEEISAAMTARLDSESDDSEREHSEREVQQPLKQPPLPDLFKDKEHSALILDLCVALTSLRRYNDALELIKLTLKVAYKTLPAGKKELFWSLGAKVAWNIIDPLEGFDFVRYIVQKHPQSIAAWNCYYRLFLRLENRLSKHSKFLHHMRVEHKGLIPPMIIVGNQFTMISQHQIAAREYLEAYKQMPENPLINLCTGTALVNLALGLRLQNKHECIAQGLAFLYNNLQLCENSQEALYNLACAYHHVGLVSLAADYYEKVLTIYQEDCPLLEFLKSHKNHIKDPDLGYCNLHREAAYNLHLIYKRSGANDLARQVLRDYCTL